jgi:hypothetical protein
MSFEIKNDKYTFMEHLPEGCPADEPQKQMFFIKRLALYLSLREKKINRKLTFHVHTFGCQMNAKDSEKLSGILSGAGMEQVNTNEADAQKKAVYNSFTSAKDYFLNWHLDLEVFRMLPYRKNTTFLIPFYEFGYSKPQNIPYTVTAEENLVFNEKIIKCWLLKHEEKGNKELFWVSKSTNEVLKMEQLINDKIYRYKIKLIN